MPADSRSAPSTVASHTTAAALWGLGGLRLSRPFYVTIPGRSQASVDGVLVHGTRKLRDHDATWLGPVPLTDLPWTLLGCAGLVDRWGLEDLVVEAFRTRRSLRHSAIVDVVDRVPNAPGAADLRRAVERFDPEQAAALLSRLEAMGLVFVRRRGFPEPTVNRRLHGPDGALIAKLDFDWEPPRITLEWDGLRYHSTPRQKRQDDARQNAVVLAGRLVLRYGWADLRDEPDRIAADLRRAFELRGRPIG